MNQFKKCKVVMLPTNQKTNIFLNRVNNKLLYDKEKTIDKILPSSSYQHLYIISDEEKIYQGDWYFNKQLNAICQRMESNDKLYDCNFIIKIIASTNPSLDLPIIPKGFIKRYCESNGSIKEIMVEFETYHGWNATIKEVSSYSNNNEYQNLPDDIRIKVDRNNTITIKPIKNSFTREEVISLCTTVYHETHFDNIPRLFSIEEWINKNI